MKQETVLLIKPDATGRNEIGEILQIIEKCGFTIEKLKMFTMDHEFVKKFYAEHVDKYFFAEHSEFMRSGRIVAALLSREDAVVKLRELVGDTESSKAALGTIRSIYGRSRGENAVHASDSPASAAREKELLFS